jgi:hypothetical protein
MWRVITASHRCGRCTSSGALGARRSTRTRPRHRRRRGGVGERDHHPPMFAKCPFVRNTNTLIPLGHVFRTVISELPAASSSRARTGSSTAAASSAWDYLRSALLWWWRRGRRRAAYALVARLVRQAGAVGGGAPAEVPRRRVRSGGAPSARHSGAYSWRTGRPQGGRRGRATDRDARIRAPLNEPRRPRTKICAPDGSARAGFAKNRGVGQPPHPSRV